MSNIFNGVIAVVNCAILLKLVYEYFGKPSLNDLINRIDNVATHYYSYQKEYLDFYDYMKSSINKYSIIQKHKHQVSNRIPIEDCDRIYDIVIIDQNGTVVFNRSVYSSNTFVKAVVVINAHPVSSKTGLSTIQVNTKCIVDPRVKANEPVIQLLESQHEYHYSFRIYTDDESAFIVNNTKLFDDVECKTEELKIVRASSLNLIVNNVILCKTKIYDVINNEESNYFSFDNFDVERLNEIPPDNSSKYHSFIDYLRNIGTFFDIPNIDEKLKYDKFFDTIPLKNEKNHLPLEYNYDFSNNFDSNLMNKDCGFGFNITNGFDPNNKSVIFNSSPNEIFDKINLKKCKVAKFDSEKSILNNNKYKGSTVINLQRDVLNCYNEISFAIDQLICHKSELSYGGKIDIVNNVIDLNTESAQISCKSGIYNPSVSHDKYALFNLSFQNDDNIKLMDLVSSEQIELHNIFSHFKLIQDMNKRYGITLKPTSEFIISNLEDYQFHNHINWEKIKYVYNLGFEFKCYRKVKDLNTSLKLHALPELRKENKYNLIDDDNGIILTDPLVKFYIKYLSNQPTPIENDINVVSVSYMPMLCSHYIVKHFTCEN